MNYFNYFTEIEERFQQRRGSLLLLSTLDWALIEIWRESGIPVEAVLRGIDEAFDKQDAKRGEASSRSKKINGLAWCAQSVMHAAEAMSEAAIGASSATEETVAQESGFEAHRIAAYLEKNAQILDEILMDGVTGETLRASAIKLRALAEQVRTGDASQIESVELALTSMEERIFSALKLTAEEDDLLRLQEQAARELAPYRGKMQSAQIRQIQDQFLQKKLLEENALPRLSLFYMSQG